MKRLSEMTHYEVLEIRSDASEEEVERAYRIARATFSEDSLAIYSIYDGKDGEAIRERIELAYRVLSEPEQRSRYDAAVKEVSEGPAPLAISLDLDQETVRVGRPVPELVPEIGGFDDLEDAEDGPFDGARLRRARLRHGIDLEQIASVTKINPSYLRFIEEEQFGDLPASVYVRGFVMAFARCVGLDPQQVAASYMERLDAERGRQARARRRRR